MRKINSLLFATSILFTSIFAACEDNNGTDDIRKGADSKYVIAASSSSAVYLLETENIENGNLSIVNNGIEADAATAWVFHSNKYAYRLVYNQGNAGTGSSYILDENGLLKERNIKFEIKNRFTTYGPYGNYVITAASGATDKFAPDDTKKERPQYGVTFTYLDVANQTLKTKTVVTENLVDNNGEYYTVSGIVDVNNKLYTALCPQGYSAYGVKQAYADVDPSLVNETGVITPTVHPNKVWVAIYNGIDFENPKIISDDRISYATSRFRSQFYQTIVPDADKNIYVFSASNARTYTGKQKTDKPSGVVRIKAGTEEFDKSYYCNIEELSGGYPMFKVWHITGDYFLLQMYAQKEYESTAKADTRRLAIFKAGDKSFKWVESGLPAKDIISSLGSSPYFENGLAYMPIVTTDGAQPTVYIIDPATASAKKGITVTASAISAIGKLHK